MSVNAGWFLSNRPASFFVAPYERGPRNRSSSKWIKPKVLLSDAKALPDLNHDQLMDATPILRFGARVMAVFAFLDEERARLYREQHSSYHPQQCPA